MKLTFTIYLKGFEEWIKTAEDVLRPLFTPEIEQEFNTFEDFAAEVYLESKTGSDETVDNLETSNIIST